MQAMLNVYSFVLKRMYTFFVLHTFVVIEEQVDGVFELMIAINISQKLDVLPREVFILSGWLKGNTYLFSVAIVMFL